MCLSEIAQAGLSGRLEGNSLHILRRVRENDFVRGQLRVEIVCLAMLLCFVFVG